MKRLIVFLMIVSLMFLSVASNIFAQSYVNVGPTTDFDGDVGVPVGKAYYINDVLLSIDDITTEDLILKADFGDEDWGDLSVSGNAVTIDEDVIDKANFADEDWGELTVLSNDVTIDDDVINIEHFVHSADLGEIKVNAGGTAIELDDDCVDIATFVASTDLGEIAVNAGGDAIEIEDDVIGAEHFADQDWGDINIATGVAQVRDLTIASEAAGDVLYFNGTNWVRLAKDEGKYLKSGASAVSWAAAAAAGNYIVHFMDVDAAATAYVHAAIIGTSASQDIDSVITNPDYGRNITITTTNVAAPAGNVTITGNLADGTTAQTDVITIVAGSTASGVKAFVTVTNINIPEGVTASDTVEVGIGDLIGLPNSIDAEADIYNKTVDGVNRFDEISTKGDTTNNTLDCATIVQNEDITISYHQ